MNDKIQGYGRPLVNQSPGQEPASDSWEFAQREDGACPSSSSSDCHAWSRRFWCCVPVDASGAGINQPAEVLRQPMPFDTFMYLDAEDHPQASGSDAPTNFRGAWLCTRVAGDMEDFLKDMGLTIQLREAAKAARYGAGHQVQNIAQVGDAFVVQNILKTPVTMRFRAGVGVQKSVDQEGKPILLDARWERDVLCVTSKKENGDLIANSRRYFDGEYMVLELTSVNGSVVKRIFERKKTSRP